MNHRTMTQAAAMTLAAFWMVGGETRAEMPVVVFDLGWTVACRDVTPEAIRPKGPTRMIEAVFRISPKLLRGKEDDLKRVYQEIQGPGDRTPVLCFAPGSLVGTDVVGGEVEIESVSGEAGASASYVIGRPAGRGEGEAHWSRSRISQRRLAPRSLIRATGTTRRGTGVFYDLRPSNQATLQEQREYAVVFQVPRDWRADYVTVECRAEGYDRGLVVTDEGTCGLAMFSVGLYLEGDTEGKEAAEALAKAQETYFQRLAEERRKVLESHRSRSVNWGNILAALDWIRNLSSNATVGMRATGNANWVGSMLSGALGSSDNYNTGRKGDQEGELPPSVRSSREELVRRQETIRKLSGRP